MGLAKTTTKLGRAYKRKKRVEKEYNTERQAFFDEVSIILSDRKLATKVIEVDGEAEDYVRQQYPGWVLQSVGEDGKAIIEEDPEWVKYTYVNKAEGYAYARNITQETPSIDDERMLAEDPELYYRVTYSPIIDALLAYAKWTQVLAPEKEIYRYVQDTTALGSAYPRSVRPWDEITEEDLEALTTYFVPGSLSVRLERRKAKAEDQE